MYEWDIDQQRRLQQLRDRRTEYRSLLEPRLESDAKLDDLGWEIFDLVALAGGSANAALRQAMDGNLRQRQMVRDDLVERDRRRSEHEWVSRYGDRAPLFDVNVDEHLRFWKQRFSRPNFTYFIQEGSSGPVKIGRSVNVRARLSNLQTGNPDDLFVRAVVPSEPALEIALHRRFDAARIPGKEWFQGELVAAVLAFGVGLAERAVHGYDPKDPTSLPLVVGSAVRASSDVRAIQRAIAVRLTGGLEDDLLDQIGLTQEEFHLHLTQMACDSRFAEIRERIDWCLPYTYRYGPPDDDELSRPAVIPRLVTSPHILAPRSVPRRQRRSGVRA